MSPVSQRDKASLPLQDFCPCKILQILHMQILHQVASNLATHQRAETREMRERAKATAVRAPRFQRAANSLIPEDFARKSFGLNILAIPKGNAARK